jgi:hypothetical protein
MTLGQVADLAGIVASAAVVASLLYVARQLRQNTDAIRVSNADNYTDFYFKLNTPVATDRQFADLWAKGESQFDTLDPVDKQRLVVWEFQALAGWSKYFQLRQRSLITDAQWEEIVGTLGYFGQRQSMREAWRMFRGIYSPGYRQFMAKYFE